MYEGLLFVSLPALWSSQSKDKRQKPDKCLPSSPDPSFKKVFGKPTFAESQVIFSSGGREQKAKRSQLFRRHSHPK